MKTILISNDDGIFGYGLKPLVEEVSKIARVLVVVPEKEQSAVSHKLTLRDPVRSRQISKNTFIMDGTPADCVRYGIIRVGKRKIDLVISGVNYGSNLGIDVFYSGTVGAAREGAFMGIPSIASSLVSRTGKNFQPAAAFTAKLAKKVLDTGKKDILLNVNIPDLPKSRLKGVKMTSLGNKIYDDTIHCKKDPYGLSYYWLKGNVIKSKNQPGTDLHTVENDMISITPLSIDGTNYEMLEKLNSQFSFRKITL
ncbi:MAG: 5'/3'-nucleotidase SurE [Elusimicrobia bacterium RIFOXYA2_FULL_39_19]|nr:MAG: 5'/3'-nucleotidase SurE [Elusimicrobia bacterium RIFOXYA2_FULL_39_19]